MEQPILTFAAKKAGQNQKELLCAKKTAAGRLSHVFHPVKLADPQAQLQQRPLGHIPFKAPPKKEQPP